MPTRPRDGRRRQPPERAGRPPLSPAQPLVEVAAAARQRIGTTAIRSLRALTAERHPR